MIQKRRGIILFLIIILFLSFLFTLKLGQIPISYVDIWTALTKSNQNELLNDIILNLRLPRIVFAILVGAGLSLCGYVMQSTIQNPLADPYILGISSGASLGAAVAISIRFSLKGIIINEIWISIFAFIGALSAMLLVNLISNFRNKSTIIRLILSGVIINSFCIAVTNLLIYFTKDLEGARDITFWTMGSLSDVHWIQVFVLAFILIFVVLYFITQSRSLNLISLGDEPAATLGIDVQKKRKLYLLIITFLTGVIVYQCGIIGFVGLVVPHSVRFICRTSNSSILPILLLGGSIFMLLVDTFSRSIIPNQEIPIGIITSLIGAPIFLLIFIQRK
ncbi:iron ABC transporter permease [Chishuiella sp.]|uniref:FecCD family ABC transporter permease n=1 Tax=Chishuiella sp. TaxID=1969467 RepID=UPI0028A6D35F|nr:iron ABC transporter permease [Chishuiella sp.]